MTEFEAETAYALSLIKKGYCSTRIISYQKSQMIKKSGLMEFWAPVDIRSVGGLNNLKQFIAKKATAYESGNEHLPALRGILLAGIPGTGKSLSCKATASILLITILFLQIFPMNLQIILPADMRIFSFSMYGIHNDILTGTAENEKVGKDVSMPIASFPTSQGYKISNTNSLTHIRTSGNTKLIFQT